MSINTGAAGQVQVMLRVNHRSTTSTSYKIWLLIST